AIFLVVASLFFYQWQLSSLVVGSYSASGKSITGSRNALSILFPTGISHEVSVSAEGVEELKRNVKIKGVKKEVLLTH
nr:hypothetical protein [Tanacetum cinerariifolium]